MRNKNQAHIEKLFAILRSALWGKPYSGGMDAKEFIHIMALAEQQTVTGLVFDALRNTHIKNAEVEVLTSHAITEQVIQMNRAINRELADFASKCNENGIDYIVVKGQMVGSVYPNPLLRMPGDIDFLVNEEYDCIRERVEKALGVVLPEKMLEKEVAFDRNDTKYELHTSLRAWICKRHQKRWDELIAKEWQKEYYVKVDDQRIRTLTPTMNAAYVFIHLFFHFIREGISLRQLCDLAMVLHHYKEEIEREILEQILKSLGMLKPFNVFGAILIDEFGLPQDEFPFSIGEKERKWKNKVLNDIFTGGNFGKLNHKAQSSWKYKMETMIIAIRNSIRYCALAPIEAGFIIPRLVIANIKIMVKRVMGNVGTWGTGTCFVRWLLAVGYWLLGVGDVKAEF